MGKIKINIGNVIGLSGELKSAHSYVSSTRGTVNGVRARIDWKVRSRNGIDSKLTNISKKLETIENQILQIDSVVSNGANRYNQTEYNIMQAKQHMMDAPVSGRGSSTLGASWILHGNGTTIWENAKNLAIKTGTVTDSQPVTSQSGKNKTIIYYLKKISKGTLDILGKAGTYGKMGALPIEILKNIVDGNGITGKDIGSIIKGMGNSIIGICDREAKNFGNGPLSTENIKELAGLSKYKTISTASAKAGWIGKLENAGTSAWDTFRTEISPIVKETTGGGTKVVDKVKTGTKVAGWALSFIANGFSNYDEWKTGGISGERAVAETVTETFIDIGKGAAIAAGVAAGCAAIGVSAPAIVVGGIGVGVSLVADIVCEKITGKGVTEAASDFILDGAAKVGKAISGATSSAKKAVSGWFNKVVSPSNTLQYSGAW